MKPLLTAKNLELFTPDGRALGSSINFDLSPGELLLVEGANGAGKSTLLRTLLRLHRNYRGSIWNSCSDHEISYLPQLGNLQFFLPMSLTDVIQVEQPTDKFEIEKLGLLTSQNLSSPWNTASGGERQKTLLSRCFLSKSRLYVLDEPLNHLDQAGALNVRRLVTSLLAKDCAVILVSHNDWTGPKTKSLHLQVSPA